MSFVAVHRSLDAAVIALFLTLVSAVTLWVAGQLYNLAVSAKYQQYKVGPILKLIFRGKFDYSLQHVLIFAVIIALLCLRPDHEATTAGKLKAARRAERAATGSKDAAAKVD